MSNKPISGPTGGIAAQTVWTIGANGMPLVDSAEAQRIIALVAELAQIKAAAAEAQTDWQRINAELLAERQARTDAQTALYALAGAVLKCDSEHCTGEDWIALVLRARMIAGAKAQ